MTSREAVEAPKPFRVSSRCSAVGAVRYNRLGTSRPRTSSASFRMARQATQTLPQLDPKETREVEKSLVVERNEQLGSSHSTKTTTEWLVIQLLLDSVATTTWDVLKAATWRSFFVSDCAPKDATELWRCVAVLWRDANRSYPRSRRRRGASCRSHFGLSLSSCLRSRSSSNHGL